MYESLYNFAVLPFENTPDPRFFYASEQHREALAAIEYTIRMRKGIILITGDIGSGKTTVGRAMLHRCKMQATIVQLLHGHDCGKFMLRQILTNLNINCEPDAERSVMLEAVHGLLHEYARRSRPVVLFVDEAQTLSDAALEELRLLSNFDTDTQKLLQLVLIGQPELRHRIGLPHFAALRQRIVLSKRLEPLCRKDVAGYIAHRIEAASRDPQNIGVHFDDASMDEVFNATNGTPRLINVICDNALLIAFVQQSRVVTREMVSQVIQDMVPTRHAAKIDPRGGQQIW